MKNLYIALSLIIMIAIAGCNKDIPNHETPVPTKPTIDQLETWLKTLPGVHSVEELKSEGYKKHYLILFKQLNNFKDSSAGTFLQRVFLSHQDLDSPVVFIAEGYHSEPSMYNTYHSELTERYKANRVEVEHRYSGLSFPSSSDWKYLSSEHAAADLHAVRRSLGTYYTGSWIATGVSKGGTNAMSYTMFYPSDVAATVSYVGPICNGMSDDRFVTHMQTVATPEKRQRLVDFQRELLIRRNILQPIFFNEPAVPTDAKENMTNDELYESTVAEIKAEILQYGKSIEEIPQADATDDQIIDYIKKVNLFNSSPSPRNMDRSHTSISEYLMKYKENFTKSEGAPDTSLIHYYIQANIELGTYAVDLEPIEDLMPNHESWSVNTLTRFIIPASEANTPHSDKLYRQMTQWLQRDDPRLICVYGEYDHWTAAAPDRAYFAGKSNMAIYIKKEGAHDSEIKGLSPADQQQVWSKLDSWVK